MNRILILSLLSIAIAGCATAPKPLRGEFAPTAPEQSALSGQVGDLVRWGGRIISVEPSPQQTCFEIVARELSSNARPVQAEDHSLGRFIACRAGFYDPAIFTDERDVTFTGRIVGFESRRIGEYDYRYPRLAAEVVYLWPVRVAQDRVYFNDPFWPGYYGGWGYRAPVIVRPVPKSESTTPPSN
jgi:outer membrane lipoprotein